jgi:hypothetical protein
MQVAQPDQCPESRLLLDLKLLLPADLRDAFRHDARPQVPAVPVSPLSSSRSLRQSLVVVDVGIVSALYFLALFLPSSRENSIKARRQGGGSS